MTNSVTNANVHHCSDHRNDSHANNRYMEEDSAQGKRHPGTTGTASTGHLTIEHAKESTERKRNARNANQVSLYRTLTCTPSTISTNAHA